MTPTPVRFVQRTGSVVAHAYRPGTRTALCYQPVPGAGSWPAPGPEVPICRSCARRLPEETTR